MVFGYPQADPNMMTDEERAAMEAGAAEEAKKQGAISDPGSNYYSPRVGASNSALEEESDSFSDMQGAFGNMVGRLEREEEQTDEDFDQSSMAENTVHLSEEFNRNPEYDAGAELGEARGESVLDDVSIPPSKAPTQQQKADAIDAVDPTPSYVLEGMSPEEAINTRAEITMDTVDAMVGNPASDVKVMEEGRADQPNSWLGVILSGLTTATGMAMGSSALVGAGTGAADYQAKTYAGMQKSLIDEQRTSRLADSALIRSKSLSKAENADEAKKLTAIANNKARLENLNEVELDAYLKNEGHGSTFRSNVITGKKLGMKGKEIFEALKGGGAKSKEISSAIFNNQLELALEHPRITALEDSMRLHAANKMAKMNTNRIVSHNQNANSYSDVFKESMQQGAKEKAFAKGVAGAKANPQELIEKINNPSTPAGTRQTLLRVAEEAGLNINKQ